MNFAALPQADLEAIEVAIMETMGDRLQAGGPTVPGELAAWMASEGVELVGLIDWDFRPDRQLPLMWVSGANEAWEPSVGGDESDLTVYIGLAYNEHGIESADLDDDPIVQIPTIKRWHQAVRDVLLANACLEGSSQSAGALVDRLTSILPIQYAFDSQGSEYTTVDAVIRVTYSKRRD